ncbi:alpha-glucoside transport system permease protein [Amycolatopsis marina]|uniref:Alpha-glucoside transport system permease protein n=1 Tax=Amycolatopsis marina TaxID=490629 RepID=A0A1I1AVP0_9PSEU|nr:ABC transporter permease subunit [Amycolatopsis marina]SFB40498.1 alpha-glucoside transport system permease protein [Amycolatopsis marina]
MAGNDAGVADATEVGHTESKERWVSDIQGRSGRKAALFLLPCVIVLALYIAYPLVFSLGRSFFDGTGENFVGLDNYIDAFTDDRTSIALKNNLIWVLVAPTLVTAFGLLFAVLTERIKWSTAFRLVLFMPMAISLFASGVIFRLVYDQDPDLGVANAAVVTVHDMFVQSSEYPGARPRDEELVGESDAGFVTTHPAEAGEVVALPMVGIRDQSMPAETQTAVLPDVQPGELRGSVWLDVSSGGTDGTVDAGERGMPKVVVQAVRDGQVVATATTADDGTFIFADLPPGPYTMRLPAENFAEPFRGLGWLGPDLVTPVIISAWIWIMTGFAMTFMAAGLAAIPRDALEAARVDGATEGQVFRRVTVPLLAPILLVVFVTLVINVLKIFDLVYVVAPGSSQAEANVLALLMWQVSFGAGGDQGLGSALSIILFLLVVPAIVFNIRRFRKARTG